MIMVIEITHKILISNSLIGKSDTNNRYWIMAITLFQPLVRYWIFGNTLSKITTASTFWTSYLLLARTRIPYSTKFGDNDIYNILYIYKRKLDNSMLQSYRHTRDREDEINEMMGCLLVDIPKKLFPLMATKTINCCFWLIHK